MKVCSEGELNFIPTSTEFKPNTDQTTGELVSLNFNAKSFIPVTTEFSSQSSKSTTKTGKEAVKSAKPDKFQTKYKTELCKNWIEVGFCRYSENCKFAHGAEEIAIEIAKVRKKKNCKAFFSSGKCLYGVRCQYRHEHRHIDQIKRYPYVVRLITYESLFANSIDQEAFLENFETGVEKLEVFKKIHEIEHAEDEVEIIAANKDKATECKYVEIEETNSEDSTSGSSQDETELENIDFYLSD